MKIKQSFIFYALFIVLLGCTKEEVNLPYETGTVTDYEGNSYKTVKIGEQRWMAENLASTKLNDGTELPNVTDDSEWAESSNPAYCWYDNDESNKRIYGALYNGYAVETGKLCPTGWHIPDSSEMQILMDNLGGVSIAGAKLKETGTEHWEKPNWGATNQYGFSALPSGYRVPDGRFLFIGSRFFMWVSDETLLGRGRGIYSKRVYLSGLLAEDNNGLAVRCIKD